MEHIIKVENLGKQYRLGAVGTGTLSHDVNRWWHKVRGKEDPYLLVGDVNDRESKGGSEYVWALKDINFEVQQGEILGIIGKNGAGKSTLLKLLSRVTAPTTGKITCHGRIASLLEVGTGFHPELTGRENIFLNGAILGMTKNEIESKFDEIVEFAGCARYIETPVKRYSSGMYVRLAFAVAAHLEPDILVVDEVLAVGDAEFQKKAIGKMKEVSEGGGRTVLFVSHNMASVQNLCTRCIWLKDGAFKAEGKTNEIIERYLNDNLQVPKVSINERKDRKGNGSVRINNIEIRDVLTDGLLTELHSGQSVKFIVYYESVDYEYETISEIHIGIPFSNEYDKFATTLNNKMVGKEFKNMPKNGTLECVIDKIPFMKGTYWIGFNFVIDGVLADSLENVIELEVLSADYYGNEKFRISERGGVYLNQSWK